MIPSRCSSRTRGTRQHGSRTRLGPVALAAALASLLLTTAPAAAAVRTAAAPAATATPIKHFLFLMQGDRSFDNYFGTYPGADGIPADACQPLTLAKGGSGCAKPYELNGTDSKPLAPSVSLVTREWDHGRMDGFAAAFTTQGRAGSLPMGHYDARDLPFAWSAASQYALFDRFFSAAPYGTRLNRAYWVAGQANAAAPTIFDRLQASGVSWKFYVQNYDPKQTYQARTKQDPVAQTARVPLLDVARFVKDPALAGHIVDLDQYYRDLAAGTLPAVAYLAPDSGTAERTARSIAGGEALVRNLVTQLQLSSSWSSSALLWSYDGSGGWYDHVAPPKAADGAQLGFRVPTLMISPYVRQGAVVHTTLDSSAALAFVERNWGLAPLGARDKASPGLAPAFDFAAGPRGAALVPVQLTAAHPVLVPTSLIYWCYGGAAVLVALLLTGAGAQSALRARRVVG